MVPLIHMSLFQWCPQLTAEGKESSAGMCAILESTAKLDMQPFVHTFSIRIVAGSHKFS
jgi:hypothetical protein